MPTPCFFLSNSLFLRHDKAVTSCLSLINNAGFATFRIGEGVEGVTDKVHLQNCLLGSHGLEGEGLDTDLELILFNVLVIVKVADEDSRLLNHLFNTGLVLSDLSFESLACSVEGGDEGLVLFFATEGGTAVVYGDFDDFYSFAYLAGDECLGVRTKELIELRKLLFNSILKAVTNRHLLAVNSNLHTLTALFREHPTVGYPFVDLAERSVFPSALIL